MFDEDALQFLSPDPAYGLLHQYTYAQGDPIHYIDDGEGARTPEATEAAYKSAWVSGAAVSATAMRAGEPPPIAAALGAGAVFVHETYVASGYTLLTDEYMDPPLDSALNGIIDKTNNFLTPLEVQIPRLNSTNEAYLARWLMANRARIEQAMKELRERWYGALSGLGGVPGCCFSVGGPPPGE